MAAMGPFVTREGDLFQVSDPQGEFTPAHKASGLYWHDTRFLSRFELLVNGAKPQLLAISAAENYRQRSFAQAAGETTALGGKAKLGVQRSRLLWGGVMYERITMQSHERAAVAVRIELALAADFADTYEVRGAVRKARGEALPAQTTADRVVLGYLGLDAILRQSAVHFAPTPLAVTAAGAVWEVNLAPRAAAVIDVAVAVAENGAFPAVRGYEAAEAALVTAYTDWRAQVAAIDSDSERLNQVLERSLLDLRLLLADRGHGPFPVAGIPWFAVPFGRDSLITALQMLPVQPDLARGTLRTMAAWQGREVNAWRQEEPGKILHVLRDDEMSNLNEIPMQRYYGTVDSTPLFLVLLAEYYAWTGDLALVRELLPNVRAALHWLDTYGDSDGDGFLEYRAHEGKGLAVQSWKDSHDSMSHRDGRPASSPVAVSEVQGYAYDAKRRLAPILAQLGEAAWAERLTQEAEALRQRFNAAYWMDDRQYLAIALDGDKAQVGTVASDAGHCLWSGIVDDDKAAAVAERLLAPDLFSGWGIRTLSTHETTYNPMSYHNGSVWPHDNALCALGLKRYGYDRAANQVATALVEAATHFPFSRLPELFCGYPQDEGMPVDYPVACSPQAWAAATPFMLVQSMLGLEPDAAAGVLYLRPALPDWLGRLTLRGLQVGAAVVDIEVTRSGTRAEVRQGQLDVHVHPSRP